MREVSKITNDPLEPCNVYNSGLWPEPGHGHDMDSNVKSPNPVIQINCPMIVWFYLIYWSWSQNSDKLISGYDVICESFLVFFTKPTKRF